jgi:hypothetical protein
MMPYFAHLTKVPSEIRVSRRLPPLSHATVAQPVVASAQTILFDEVDDAQVGELRIGLITPRRATGADTFAFRISLISEQMVVEKLVDQTDHLRSGLYLLGGRFGVLSGQCFCPPASEADVDPGPLGGELSRVTSSTR